MASRKVTDKNEMLLIDNCLELIDFLFIFFEENLPPNIRPDCFVTLCEMFGIDPWKPTLTFTQPVSAPAKRRKKTVKKKKRK